MNIIKKISTTMSLSRTQQRAQTYPNPFVVQPKSGNHRQSFIILHGRGDEGQTFGLFLLMTEIPGFKNLQDTYPDGKFVFPTASKRRANAFNRTGINQWFDIESIVDQTVQEELQFEGLRESYLHVHTLLEREIEAVGVDNVVLWGLSQGMAMAMTTLLLRPGPKFAAAVGMCGWMPLKARLEKEVEGDDGAGLEGEENPFDDTGTGTSISATESNLSSPSDGLKLQKAVRYLREELQLIAGPPSSTALQIPVYLGHGSDDEKVPTTLGQEAKEFLQILGFDVEFQLYKGLHHWYSPEMLRDIILFLHDKTGIQPVVAAQDAAT